MGADLNTIFKSLGKYFDRYKVVSEDEIALVVGMETGKLDEATRKELEEQVQGDLEETLVKSITSEPISVYSPNLTSKRNYLGETFYHYPTHDFLADDLEKAFKRLSKIRALGKLDAIEDVVGAFLSRSGYEVSSRPSAEDPLGCREMVATKGERRLTVFILPSINFAADYAENFLEDQEYVIVIPTETTPAPFIRFCREEADAFYGKKIEFWVADPDKEVVNPFLGYTQDDEIYRNFENPKLASFACRMYGVGKDLWVRAY
jgi:hypothetical protein